MLLPNSWVHLAGRYIQAFQRHGLGMPALYLDSGIRIMSS
jgi:hypothetical protein